MTSPALRPHRNRAGFTVLPTMAPLAHWRLLEAAFEPMRAPRAIAFVPIGGGLAACATAGAMPGLWWPLLMLASIVWSQRLARQFDVRGAETAAEHWARLHAIAAWCQAAAIGAGAVLCAGKGGQATQLLLAWIIGFAVLQAAATATFTRTFRGQVLLMAAPMTVACLLSFTPVMAVAGLVFVLQSLAALALAEQVIAREQAGVAGDGARLHTPLPALFAEPPSAADFQKLMGRDQTTGLPNRHSFMHLLAQESARAVRAETQMSVLLLLWDGYDALHATQPQPVVDEQRAEIARRLRTGLRRRTDLIASLGGGRFAAILPFTDAFGASTVARNLQAALGTPALVADNARLSIGAATYCGKGPLPETQLLQFAEEALASARNGGGNKVARYDPMAATLRPAAWLGPRATEPTSFSEPVSAFKAVAETNNVEVVAFDDI